LDWRLKAARADDSRPQSPPVTVAGEQKLPQIPALTGIRFFAAFFILFEHAVDWLVPFQDPALRANFTFVGMYGMPLFFVLSGVVIHYNYGKLFASRGIARATCEFAAARFARLFPLYLFLLFMAVFADDFLRKTYHAGDLFAKVLAYNVTLTQSWWYAVLDQQLVINWLFPISWSISTELYFYVAYVAAVFLILLLRGPRAAVAVAIGFAVAAAAMFIASRFYLTEILGVAQRRVPNYIDFTADGQNSFYRWLFYFSPYARMFEFFLGCLTVHAFMLLRGRPVTARERQLANVGLLLAMLALGVLAALYLSVINPGPAGPYVQLLALNFLCAPALAFILFYVCRYDTGFTRFLSAPILVALGDMSYSIYLLHAFTIRLFFAPPPPQWDWIWGLNAFFRVLFAIVLTLLLAYATYRLIEVPSRVWLRAKLGRMIAIGFGDAVRSRQKPAAPDIRAAPIALASPATRRAGLLFSAASISLLLLVAVAGQAAQSGEVWRNLHRLWVGPGPEIAVVSASYGLNCRTFVVPAPFSNRAAPGNVTSAVKRACDARDRCEFFVDAGRIGDPVNSCGKDFSVEYRCTGSEVVHSAYLPAEAHGHRLTLDCMEPR
jgi:peptidoglycan/LPS O-acetylase OafA/YrhL